MKKYEDIDKYNDLKRSQKGSFAQIYENKKQSFQIDKCDTSNELQQNYVCFQTLLERVNNRYKDFFKEILDKNDVTTNKRYYELSAVYINEIQNLYLNPINYKLNQIQVEHSLSKAEKSIRIAIISFAISIIISCISLYYTIHFGKNPTPCSCGSVDAPNTKTQQTILEKDSSSVNMKIVVDTINKSK